MPRGATSVPEQIRLAELVAALSLGIDLGFGQPMEHVLRQCLIALRLGEVVGLDEPDRAVVYYTALLINVGCHSDAHEQAKWFGDDIELKLTKYTHEMHSVAGTVATLGLIGAGHPPLHRFRVGLEFAFSGHREVDRMIEQHAELACRLAGRLGLSPSVQEAVACSYEMWDGRGWPGRCAGEAIPVAARLATMAEFIEVAHRVGGVAGALALADKRSGTQFDPDLATALAMNAERIFDGLDDGHTFQSVIAAEPSLTVTLNGPALDAALTAVADFVDLKSPYTLGRSRAVAALARGAGSELGLPADELDLVARAALVHGFGRLGVSNAIWDKKAPLATGERERARMYPYFTERMLEQSPALAPIGAVAAQVQERLDGSGYPRRLTGAAIGRPARLLAAAAAYRAMCEPRPHRDARAPEFAARELRAEVREGRLDAAAVDAVLTAAGHRPKRRRAGPAGLTSREVDVLGLLARGLSSREIADRLFISTKTVRNHTEHIYTKIGVTGRVGASLFAVEHGLLGDDAADPG